MAFKITDLQYISWVQRSLNRLLGSVLLTDGRITLQYRDLIEEFQFAYGLARTRGIHAVDQDKLIRANHVTVEYIEWLQTSLKKVGVAAGLSASGNMDTLTEKAILAFQSYMGRELRDDGWVGPRTETVLIRECGDPPPGTIVRGIPPIKPKKPKPKRVRPSDPLTIRERTDRVIGALLAELTFNPSTYPDAIERKRLKCLLHKLKKRVPSDDLYIPADRAYAFVKGGRASDWSFSNGKTTDHITKNAREELEKAVRRLPVSDRTDHEKIRPLALELLRNINTGLVQIESLFSAHGDSSLAARELGRWVHKRQEKPKSTYSIIACFK